MSAFEWRYLPRSRVKHLLADTSDAEAVCGVYALPASDWRGTGSQGEHETLDSLRECRRCISRRAASQGPRSREVRLDPAKLYAALDGRRRERGITGRELLRQVGEHTPSSLGRLQNGAHPSADLLVRFLAWLGETDLAPYLSPVGGDQR